MSEHEGKSPLLQKTLPLEQKIPDDEELLEATWYEKSLVKLVSLPEWE